MESSTANQITTPGNQNFFLSPQFPLQRQYEALRAYLVEEEASADVARRFGYSPGAFRVLCYQFGTTLKNAPPSSASRNADLNLLPPAIGSVIWRLPCGNVISRSMTCSGNWLPPATPSASTPSRLAP